ncbi:beta-defensin 119 isoform X1 [Tupaia chinensis]|uniref:beta-defensin 119 isoform X1 n=1 Tax=Tupaia chinensis TaxID=246437 RepID=UPI0003C8F784|nr:beta-defensin 119 isoform X1 [Tupaia chinensis]
MKLIFLFLAILLAMEPVMSECWMKGHCRLVCKDDEQNIIRCKNRKRCCVLTRYITAEPMTIDGILAWTSPQTSTPATKKKRNRHRG